MTTTARDDHPVDRAIIARFAADAIVVAPFLALWLSLLAIGSITDAERAAADPIVAVILVAGSPLLCGALTAAALIFWTRRAICNRRHAPSDESAARPWLWAGAGALAACAMAGILRLIVGSELPAFIPPEESSRPGMLLGMSAALIEETLFRLALVPALLILVRHPLAGPLAAIFGSALLLPLSHELPLDGVIEWNQVATRTLFPGAIMTAAAIWIRPAFVLSAHCTAHVAIPFLFH